MKRNEAILVRDPLAQKLQELGWIIQTERTLGMQPWPAGRCDIVATRGDETRVIECKLRQDWNAIGQVLRYTAAVDDRPTPSPNVRPTIALGERCSVDFYTVCDRAGIDVWTPSMIRRGVQEVPFRC